MKLSVPARRPSAVLLWFALAARPSAAPSLPVDPRVNYHKHLVLDSRVIAETNNVRLELGRVEKDAGNPLFQADRPWENASPP